MKLGYSYGQVSGFSAANAAFLAYRFEKKTGFKSGKGESWACALRKDDLLCRLYGKDFWLTGLWYSREGDAWVCGSHGELTVLHDVQAEVPETASDTVELGHAWMGIWGLNQKHVIAWGDQDQSDGVMARFDGKKWSEMPSPFHGVMAVHGVAPDLIFAVGTKGRIARWNGKAWKAATSPTSTTLTAVHVVSPDEIYACGSGRHLLEGSVHGWADTLEAEWPLSAVAKWKGDVWVAATKGGLAKLAGGSLQIVKPNVEAQDLDARKDLMIGCPLKIVATEDGEQFFGYAKDFILESLEDKPPMWITRA